LKPSDHALASIKAGLNLIPSIGGAIASLIGDYVPLSTERAIETTTELLREKLTALEGRLDTEIVDKDEFSELFKSCYLVIVRTNQETKLRAAAALLANLLLKPGDSEKVSYTELDHFVRCLDSLSVGAILTLGAANQLAVEQNLPKDSDGNYTINFEQLHSKLTPMESSLLMGLVGELNAFNLFHTVGRPAIPTAQYGNYPVQLTPLGRRFVEKFIEN
jgi:hypothetical protein